MSNHTFPECFEPKSFLTIFVGMFIIIGTVLSVIPQYITLIKKRDSKGISGLFLALRHFSGLLTLVNQVIFAWGSLRCCEQLNLMLCLENNLQTWQLATGPVTTLIFYILFITFYKVSSTETHTVLERIRSKSVIVITFIGLYTTVTILGLISLYLAFISDADPSVTAYFGRILGYIATVFIVLQWGPQIWVTFQLKSSGSLSLFMLLLQAPGSFLVVFFQAILNSAEISTWGPFLMGGLLQLFLIIMIIYYDCTAPKSVEDQSLITPYQDGETPKSRRKYKS